MRVAVIDCGTNTFNLLVVDLSGPERKKVCNTRVPVKLGEGSINNGYIGEAAFQRAVEAIREFKNTITSGKVDKVIAFATSAVRDARNGRDLVERIKQDFDIAIQVIDGDSEARLIYLGIREAVKLTEANSLIMDIGGGSTEFIIASGRGIVWKHSFNIGAARLLQRFRPSDPLTAKEKSDLENYLEQELHLLTDPVKQFAPVELVGSSGAFESVIEMINSEMNGEPLLPGKTEYEVALDDHFKISSRIIKSTLEERKKISGLVPMRLDMIVISCLMMDFILTRYDLKKFRVSTYSLKEGALADLLAEGNGNNM